MALALKRIKVYLKLTAIVTVVVLVLLIVLKNQEYRTDIWFFRQYEQINVLWLILITAVCSIAGWWLVSKIFSTLRELRELRRTRQSEEELARQRRLAQELAERERRIDEKIRRSIAEGPDRPTT
ncbi:MAG: hypothetical protein AMXMBFR13_20400 [Phycisphaerae bacterium]